MLYCLCNDQLDMNNFICAICQKPVTEYLADVVTIRKIGSDEVNRASQTRSGHIFTELG